MSAETLLLSDIRTLTEALAEQAHCRPLSPALTFLVDGSSVENTVTYADLLTVSMRMAVRLREELHPGDRVLLLLPPGLEFVQVFLACLHARVIAVPAPAPASGLAGFAAARQRIEAIVSDSTPALVVCSPELALIAEKQPKPTTRCMTPTSLLASEESGYSDDAVVPDTIAFLQYTSGSTSIPRGVMVSHANVIANHRVILRSMVDARMGIGTSWLPMFHDMGLISILFSIRCGEHCVFMSPTHFVQRPIRWLRAISKYRASWSGGPNFAFDMCVKKTRLEDRADLDLSCWDYAFTGGEPIRALTLRRFCETFEPYGFKSSALRPCFGLAEGTLMVTCSRRPHPLERTIARQAYGLGRVEAPLDERNAQVLVSSGTPHEDVRIVLVDPATGTPCVPGQVGEIWTSGKSVSRGYWNRPEENARVFAAHVEKEGPFLRTGDLGFVEGGELFVSGRLKDVVIARGRKLHPNDIEADLEIGVDGVRASSACAFGVTVGDEERVVIVASVESGAFGKDQLIEAIRRRLAERFELSPSAVLLVRPGDLPRTSSGKVQRAACKRAFLDGAFREVARWSMAPAQETGA